MFADIPDNLGMKYQDYYDNVAPEHYYNWINLLLLEALPKTGLFWLSYYPKHDLEISYIVRNLIKNRHPGFSCDKFLWTFTFSQYNDRDCAYGYRPIMRLASGGGVTQCYPDQIREISRRQELGDYRAAVEGRVPSNVWAIPRVVGNSPERREWMPTQHPIRLMERILAFSVPLAPSIDPANGARVVDLFGGSGATLRAGLKLGLGNIDHVELSRESCAKLSSELNIPVTLL